MPEVLFVCPAIGRFEGRRRYVRSWQMKPLALGVLAAATGPEWTRRLVDDRLEEIDYAVPADLVAITVETYTARRAYQIADEFRRRGRRVVMGGYHASLRPAEAAAHADAVCIGRAERLWPRILDDARAGTLEPVYRDESPGGAWVSPDQSLFAGKDYFGLEMVETSRGCPNRCSFCSIAAFYGQRFDRKPAAQVAAELAAARSRVVFFVDDNFAGDRGGTLELLAAIKPLRKLWITQVSVHVAADVELLEAMRDSGCAGVLVGFESSDPDALRQFGKDVNARADYAAVIEAFGRRGIGVYGTFLFGYDGDTAARREQETRLARRAGLYLAAFNHVVPFPGTQLYEDLERQGRLRSPAWWLEENARFGMVTYRPAGATAGQVEAAARRARSRFYRWGSILSRARKVPLWRNRLANWLAFGAINWMMRREGVRFGMPLGQVPADRPHRRGLGHVKSLRGEVVELTGHVDAEIRELLDQCPMGGAMAKTLHLPGGVGDSLAAVGREHWVLGVRDARHMGQLVGLGVISAKPAWNGDTPIRLGYLSLLRVHPAWQGRGVMAAMFQTFSEQLSHLSADLCVSSIFDDNRAALATLLRRHKRWPRYTPLAALTCRVFTAGRCRRLRAGGGMNVSPCTPDELPELIDFLRRSAIRRSLMPDYRLEDFSQPGGLLAGLAPGDVMLARRQGVLVACCGLWDQDARRQYVIARYRPWLACLRPAANLLLGPAGLPTLPRAGEPVAIKQVALAIADDAPAFEAALGSALGREPADTRIAATLGQDDGAERVVGRLGGFCQRSTLYRITPAAPRGPVTLAGPLYVEGGSL